jgi:hypothetical protein
VATLEPHVLAEITTGVRLWTVDETVLECVAVTGCLAVVRSFSFVGLTGTFGVAITAALLLALRRLYLDRNRVHTLSLVSNGELNWHSLRRSGRLPAMDVKRVIRDTKKLSASGAEPELWRNTAVIITDRDEIMMNWMTYEEFKTFSRLLAKIREFNPLIELSRKKSSYLNDEFSFQDPTEW